MKLKKIIDWHKKTFPNATHEAVEDKLLEEVDELIYAILNNDNESILEEVADVFIVSFVLIERYTNKRFFDIIDKKMNINKARKWGKEIDNGDRPRSKKC